ncbi:hypothetical protein DFR52_102573 [Hoeflea marina]|uniref:Uncharacterized protein n=1 Tax=Hoeflea marina TaxID=274592 RepID=A0A317PNW8_9HYPH|nr:hypothetical protein [Hoeflea marina]PWW01909.1 hypothetical protein DFR52_102573 [Hoeflea marina]
MTARLFGDRDFDLLDAAAKGQMPAGFLAREFQVVDRRPALTLANTCGKDVRFHFASPDGTVMKYFAVKAGTTVTADSPPFIGEYLFSIDNGNAASPGTREVRFRDETYHMIEVSTGSDHTLIWNEACRGG